MLSLKRMIECVKLSYSETSRYILYWKENQPLLDYGLCSKILFPMFKHQQAFIPPFPKSQFSAQLLRVGAYGVALFWGDSGSSSSSRWSASPWCLCGFCRRGRGTEQPGPGALRVDPEGARLRGGPRAAGGGLPEEALRVRHQDPHEDPGAEPPHPLLRQAVSLPKPCVCVTEGIGFSCEVQCWIWVGQNEVILCFTAPSECCCSKQFWIGRCRDFAEHLQQVDGTGTVKDWQFWLSLSTYF